MNDNKNEKTSSKKSRGGRHIAKRVFQGLVVLAVLGGIVFAALPKPIPVEVEGVEQGDLVVVVDEDGRTRLKDRYVVSSPLAGNLARIELKAGDEVSQGVVLARIVPLPSPLLDARSRSEGEARIAGAVAAAKQAEAQIERAKVALSFAKKEAARSRQLKEGGAVSAQEVERAELEERSRAAELTSATFGSKVAAHELRMARAAFGRLTGEGGENADHFEVPSPAGGRVLKVIQESEGVVQPGSPLLELGDPKALEIVVDVLTQDAVNISPGAPVRVEEWGGASLDAVVRIIEPSAFTRVSALGVEEQRVNAIIDLKAAYEQWRELGDGYRVEARIEVLRANGVITAPASALFRRDGEWAAFAVEGNVARLRHLRIGKRSDRKVEVLSGLSAGERVIAHPSDKIVDGAEVAF